MTDDKTQRAVAGIRADLADVSRRLTELKAAATSRDYHWRFQITGILGLIDLARENLQAFDVEDVIGRLLEAGEEWTHPVSILGRLRLSDEEITAAVRARLKPARGRNRERLAELLRKLDYSRELLEHARQRRRKR